MRILVISHTEHYKDNNGDIVGWGPTVKELDCLADAYGEIIHIACYYKNTVPPATSVAYKNARVTFIPIRPFGGKGIVNKLSIITTAFSNLKKIRKELKAADAFQFRAPTSIGLYIIPYLTFFCRKKGWYKYAGNWQQKNAPWSYRIQRWMLLHMQSRLVTINGKWDNQKANCLSFENPCLTDMDRVEGLNHTKQRVFSAPYKLCFVGRLDKEKGIYSVIEAIKKHPNKLLFSQLDIIGDGPEKENLNLLLANSNIKAFFHGAMSRDNVFKIYKQSDFILLPSESEGFPKVVAEAANFGCIPIVSDVSAIGQYVNEQNGFLWANNGMSFPDYFGGLELGDAATLKQKSLHACNMAEVFTFSNYIHKLRKYILSTSE